MGLLATGVAGFSKLWGFDPLTGLYHVGVGLLFAYAGFLQRDAATVRRMVGGLGVLLLVVKMATVLGVLVAYGLRARTRGGDVPGAGYRKHPGRPLSARGCAYYQVGAQQEEERREEDAVNSRILVVEDDEAVREAVEEALSREGLRTVGVCDGEEALERLAYEEPEPFGLVVLDLILPGETDGFSVCRKIRAGEAGEANKDVPVVVLSVRGDETSVVEGLEAGVDDYVKKPFSVRELTSRVVAHLGYEKRPDTSGDSHREGGVPE